VPRGLASLRFGTTPLGNILNWSLSIFEGKAQPLISHGPSDLPLTPKSDNELRNSVVDGGPCHKPGLLH
jgi:hypothetical protein